MDENEFYRQAALQILSSLDKQKRHVFFTWPGATRKTPSSHGLSFLICSH
ncbi:MAG TPA: hypothetical protein VLD55_08130 [Candidatus Sulfobium mesophilum]|nr:hypothetical protein [Candidatus Sulfobium mesophilum]